MINKIITSTNNDIVKLAAALKLSGGRKKHGLFVLEGEKLIAEAINWGFKNVHTFVLESCQEKYKQFLTENAYIISQKVLEKIADSETPQGIVATFEYKENSLSDIKKAIVLENIQDPGNVGTIFRTAESFDIDAIILVGNSPDIYSPKVIRASMGSVLRMPYLHFETADKAFEYFNQKGITVYSAILDKNAASLTTTEFVYPCAVAIGNEGRGLSEDFIKLSHKKIYIPMSGKTESLNAAIAASIFIWSLFEK